MLLAAAPAASQESPLPDLFADVNDVRVVNVEVVVTDDEGYRITGLEANDFELLVDGETVPIDGQWKNEVEFRISVVDRYGDRSRNLGSRIPILYAETPPPGETFVYETELPIRRREHRFLAAVYDPVTGEILSYRGIVGAR